MSGFTQFGVLSESEWIKFAVCEVFKTKTKSKKSEEVDNTPYDERMGVLENGKQCSHCGHRNKNCIGHFGYIRLEEPVFNEKFYTVTKNILKSICLECSSPRILRDEANLLGIISRLGPKRLSEYSVESDKVFSCSTCNNILPTHIEDRDGEIYAVYSKDKTAEGRHVAPKEHLSARKVYNIFTKVTNDTMSLLGFNQNLSSNPKFTNPDHFPYYFPDDNDTYNKHRHQTRPESFIFTVFPVIPPASRPWVIAGDEKHDDHLTDKYDSIIKENNRLKNPKDRAKSLKDLKMHIHTLIDNNKDESKSTNNQAQKGIFERIQGKEGMVNKNCMGKRVEKSARTVIIGGGSFVEIGEIGIPKRIAKDQTREEMVCEFNFEYLQNLVNTGKARYIKRGKTSIDLKPLTANFTKPYDIKIGEIVERPIRDGDWAIVNRQPTLRQESMFCMRVKIHHDDTLAYRLPLEVTKALNADFDGDEINLHFPQNYYAIAECQEIMNINNFIVSAQNNSNICGSVQDTLDGAYILTNTWKNVFKKDDKSTFVEKGIFMDCLFSANLEDEYTDLLERASKYYNSRSLGKKRNKRANREYGEFGEYEINGKILLSAALPRDLNYEKRTEVNKDYPVFKVKNGIILPKSGPLCEKTIGASTNSIIHKVWLQYSPETARKIIASMSKLVYRWFPTHGFSMGISDCISSNQEDVYKELLKVELSSKEIIDKGVDIEDNINNVLNGALNVGSKIANNTINKGEKNALVIMEKSGAKGKSENCAMICGFVGQQNVDGKRIKKTLTNGTRCLPHFKPGDDSPSARGFVKRSFIQGLSFTEVFFHAIGGRRGLIDTSQKTSESGYESKKISRKLEDLKACYDGSIRNSKGFLFQYVYGDDGMDPKYLTYPKGFNFPTFCVIQDVANRFCLCKKGRKYLSSEELGILFNYLKIGYVDRGKRSIKKDNPNPIYNKMNENMRNIVLKQLEDIKVCEKHIPKFIGEIYHAFLRAKVEYGYMAGLTAASSVGEPVTQMTLNSVSSDTKIILYNQERTKVVEIGKWIDNLLDNNSDNVQYFEQNGKNTEYLDLNECTNFDDTFKSFQGIEILSIPTVDGDGRVTWGDITAITRHPPHGDLIKITTRGGRSVIATKSKSLLIWDGEEFVQKPGSDAKVGDYVPTLEFIPKPETPTVSLQMKRYLSPNEWLYGTQTPTYTCHDLWNQFENRAPMSSEDDLKKNHGTNKLTKVENNEATIFHPKRANRVVSKIPEIFPLDEETGFFVGIYLAEGWATETFVGISNNDETILNRVKKFCKRFSITHHTTIKNHGPNDRFPGARSTDLKIHSVILARFLKKWIGTGSSIKRVPEEAYSCKKSFVKGLLDGYISGDGTVSKRDKIICASSTSKFMLEGISTLCNRFNIFGKLSSHQVTHNNVGSKNIKRTYTIRIANVWATRFAEQIGSSHPEKSKLMTLITHTKRGRAFKRISNNSILDSIVSIEILPEKDYEFVYDITVPSTTNFCIHNGMGVADTFHFSGMKGADVTLGLPRFKELMNSTENPKTPSCNVYFKTENKYEIKKNQKYIQNITIKDLLKSHKIYALKHGKTSDLQGMVTIPRYQSDYFYGEKLTKEFLGGYYAIELIFDVYQCFIYDITLKNIANTIAYESDKRFRCYLSPNCFGKCLIQVSSNFDVDEQYMYELVRDVVLSFILKQRISGISSISSCKLLKNFDTKREYLSTTGTNLREILSLDIVDTFNTTSNDIWDMYKTFGIEATRSFLISEITSVISFNGTYINPRHLTLLVDAMVFSGTVTSVSRNGISREVVGPIAKCTFEKSIDNFSSSAMFTDNDVLGKKCPLAASILLGEKPMIGSGVVEILENKNIFDPTNIEYLEQLNNLTKNGGEGEGETEGGQNEGSNKDNSVLNQLRKELGL